MIGKVPESRCVVWAIVVASLWIGTGSARAEVGVAKDGPVEHLFEARIIEDSDPVGASWRPAPVPRPHRHLLNPDGEANDDGRPSLLYNSISGLPIVAWAKKTTTGFDVVVSLFDGGAWSIPEVLATDATVTEHGRPRLVLNPNDGSVHLLYWEDETAPRVMHRQAPPDLSSWSAPVQVSQPGEIAKRPAGVFHDGVLHVVYESHGPGHSGIPRLLVLATQNGSTFTTEVVETSNYHGPNWIQVHSRSGKLWVDWIDGDNEMCWTRRSASSSWEPIQVEPFSGIEERDYHVRGKIGYLAVYGEL